jgi:hypothetical protein
MSAEMYEKQQKQIDRWDDLKKTTTHLKPINWEETNTKLTVTPALTRALKGAAELGKQFYHKDNGQVGKYRCLT